MTAFRGLDTVSGEVLKAAALVERVGWLTTLVETMAAGVVGGHWSRAELAVLASGVARSGGRLPSNAWMALRTLGWSAAVPAGLYVPDRVRRVAEEQAGRVLRSAEWRAALVDAVLETWPAGGDPMKRGMEEWAALRAACPQGTAVPASVFRSRTRQVARFLAAYRRLPAGLCELEAAPGGGRQVVLAAADKQLATLARCEDDPARYAVLTVRLPVCPAPRTRCDWHPVRIRFRLPPTIDNAVRANGVLAKADRLRILAEHLWTKAAHLETLLGGRRALGLHPDPAIVTKLAVVRTEHSRVSRRRRRLNAEIAKAAARFMVDHARAARASVIYLEDLRDMESRGKGRTLNSRLSSSVRGQIVADVRHQAARHGIAVVIVPARGTSKYCPRCLTAFRHHAAPDNTRPGWKWATCPHPDCGYSADRDVAAWQRIGARGLQHQHLTVLDRASGTYVIRRTVQELDQPVQHPKPTHADRTKSGPTRDRPVPRQRRRVPAPPGTPAAAPAAAGQGGKRPAGRQPQPPTHRNQRRGGRQAPHTMSTPNRHRPCGARLGAGFHLHTHATPITQRPRRDPRLVSDLGEHSAPSRKT
ncbi:zinc ribbon domain-containing protein [Streptomyces sp. NBC_00347]|uniref:zinc ribbon domain-containing protein n=1 Tax=Streptomyces sp. NBC_00347 TaxID=2975721 RepID=UPI0022552229|nr:zinc ribbon domain-containing protein [Streptomyces sp. NBC_00347]MCX5127883.1 transposase [Streptomyces sp. NBC_00347]